MDKKTAAIVATLVSVLLCGCPGIFAEYMGAMFAILSLVPGADIDMFGSTDPSSAMTFGIGGLCGGLLFILIPVIVGILMFRRAKEQ